MKPSFALHITDTTIGLLHRTARGWLQVGETAFDTADLAEALGYLRGSALGLSPGGLTTKLVLPNSQVKYLELEASGPTDVDRRNQIRAALVGRTPYNVDDLVFDWSGTGAKVRVAVVARETLDEAEAFATEHRFNPVSFVGLPLAGDFKGEPWFGPSKLSATLLEKGEKVDRDADAIQVAARDLPKSHPGAAKAASSEPEDAGAKDQVDKDKPTRAQRRATSAAAPVEDVAIVEPVAPAALPEMPPVAASVLDAMPESAKPTAEPISYWRTAEPLPDVTAAPEIAAAPQVTAAPSVTNSQAFPEAAAASPGDAAQPSDDLPPAPSAAMMAAFASRRAAEAQSPKRFGGPVAPPLAATPSVAFGGSDLADRLAGKSTPPPLSRPKVGEEISGSVAALRAELSGEGARVAFGPATPKALGSKPNTAFVTAPNIPGSRKRKSAPAGAQATPSLPDGRKALTKPGGTFASSKERGKSKYLGWILTGLLILFLALIAAWSSFFMTSNDQTKPSTAVVSAPQAVDPGTAAVVAADAPLASTPDAPAADVATTDTANTDAADTGDVPAIADEISADSQNAADVAAPTDGTVVAPAADIASAATGDALPDPAVPAATVAAPPVASVVAALDPAPVGVASVDVPNAAPSTDAQDEIFLAMSDAPPLAVDPLALPQPTANADALPVPQLEPPPFGTVYQFDADGRIRPTPEGIITPEGVRLVAGKPSVVPPQRPTAVVAAALPVAAAAGAVTPLVAGAPAAAIAATTTAAAVPFPSDPALADARPRLRPNGLAAPTAKTGDGAALASPADTRVSSLRPLPRPAVVLAAGEAARKSTAAASLTAQADQAAAVEAAVQASFQPDANSSPFAVRVSRIPAARPKDMSSAVEAAVAVAVRTQDPQVDTSADNTDTAAVQPGSDSEPELASAAPSIPTRASVAKQATYVNAINLSKINLIGVYGSKSKPYALIRQANGRYKKVQVGDSIDGGRVAAIGASEVQYQKSGRMISLKMPKT